MAEEEFLKKQSGAQPTVNTAKPCTLKNTRHTVIVWDFGEKKIDRLKVGWPSHVERRCSNLGPTQSRISPSIQGYLAHKTPPPP